MHNQAANSKVRL